MDTLANGSYAENYHKLSDFQFDRGITLLKLASLNANERVLDLGCGTGRLSIELANSVAPDGYVVGIDPDKDRIDIAKRYNTQRSNLRFIRAGVEELGSLNEGPFDLIFSNFVVHWFQDKKAAFKQIKEALAQKGRFVFMASVGLHPDVTEIINTIGDVTEAAKSKYLPLGENEWVSLLKSTGFKVAKKEPVTSLHKFSSIDAYLYYLEASTHGMLRVADIPNDSFEKLTQMYADEVPIHELDLRLVAIKE